MPEDKQETPPPVETLEGTNQPTAGDQVAAPSIDSNNKPSKTAFWHRLSTLKEWSNFYLLIFFILFILVIAAIAAVFAWNDRQGPAGRRGTSLTSEELSQISANTALVGDPQQTIDIQGNTIFQGQVLARKNVEIAGSLKVGGELSWAGSQAGGLTFDQLEISDNLTVAGAAALQGGLTVNGAASFAGALSAGSISVNTLELKGDLRINRHLTTSGPLPSKSNGSALGSGGTVSVNGSDTAGTVTVNTGGSPPAGCFVTVTFANGFGSTPHVIISPSNSNAAGLNYYTTRTTSNFRLCSTNAPAASKTYIFDYFVID